MPYFREICEEVVSDAWESPFKTLFNKAENQKCQDKFQ
jgi:hypothetical protein